MRKSGRAFETPEEQKEASARRQRRAATRFMILFLSIPIYTCSSCSLCISLVIGASMSEPHTRELNGKLCV